MNKRTAIILTKDLNRGAAANVAAILMGQIAALDPDLYNTVPPRDKDGSLHAAIQYSVVILEANSVDQIVNYLVRLRSEFPELVYTVFANAGRALNNQFDEYRAIVAERNLRDLEPIGIAVTGPDEQVRSATKKFSLAK